jgi:hypothetical protein
MITFVLAIFLAADSVGVSQLRTCATLISVLQRTADPTISDLHACFGDDDDGELDAFALTLCHTKCDSLIDSACGAAFDERLQHADTTPSILLTAARRFLRARGFLTGTVWIEWPARAAPYEMHRIRVRTKRGTLVFEFLEDSAALETIYLPDGRTVFSAALPGCPKVATGRRSPSATKPR